MYEVNTVIPRYSRGLRSQEMPQMANFGACSKTGATLQSVKFERKTSLSIAR